MTQTTVKDSHEVVLHVPTQYDYRYVRCASLPPLLSPLSILPSSRLITPVSLSTPLSPAHSLSAAPHCSPCAPCTPRTPPRALVISSQCSPPSRGRSPHSSICLTACPAPPSRPAAVFPLCALYLALAPSFTFTLSAAPLAPLPHCTAARRVSPPPLACSRVHIRLLHFPPHSLLLRRVLRARSITPPPALCVSRLSATLLLLAVSSVMGRW